MAETFKKPKAFTKEWYEYIWDYYKAYFIVGIVAAILIVYTVVEICTTVRYDTNINFVATVTLDSEMSEKLSQSCAEISGDLNENGKVDIAVNQLNFTEENRKNTEMHSALQNKLMAIFASNDELVFIMDSTMLEQIQNMNHIKEMFYLADDWAKGEYLKKDDIAVSLNESVAMKSAGIESSDMYVLVAKMDYEPGLKKAEENAIKIANFLIK